jgi:hypothetical protein
LLFLDQLDIANALFCREVRVGNILYLLRGVMLDFLLMSLFFSVLWGFAIFSFIITVIFPSFFIKCLLVIGVFQQVCWIKF